MARPKIDIDPAEVEKLAAIHCTMLEIASVVGCSVDTLERRFADVIKKGREQGKMSLKRAQFTAALNGNVVMLIWLGKQHLGQSDRVMHQVETANLNVVIKRTEVGPIEWEKVGVATGNAPSET